MTAGTTIKGVKYPQVVVEITGRTAKEVARQVVNALRVKGVSEIRIQEFVDTVNLNDYEETVDLSMKWVKTWKGRTPDGS